MSTKSKPRREKSLEEVLAENLRMRISYIGVTWETAAIAAGEAAKNVRNWATYGKPTVATLERLAKVLNVPPWSLLHPEFDPRDYEKPDIAETM